MKQIFIFNQPVHPVSLKFSDPGLEKQFWKHYIDNYFRQVQIAQILAILLYSFVIITQIVLIEVDIFLATPFLVLVILSLAIGFLLTLFKPDFYKRYYREFNVYYVLVTSLSLIHTGYYAPGPFRGIFYCGVMICLFFNFAVIRQDIVRATVTGSVLFLVLLLVVLIPSSSYQEDHLIVTYILATNILGMVLAYMIEYDNKKYFLMVRRINADSLELANINRNLERRVEERTRDLEIAKNKAEESDRLKSSFLENISHEIRTPMNGILGFTGLLLNHDLSGEQQLRYIRIINKSGERLLRTVNNLMDISMIETGIIKPVMVPVNLPELLKSLHEFFLMEARDKGLRLEFNDKLIPEDLVYVTDKSFLESILSNMIKNSLKFTDEGYVEFGLIIGDADLRFYVRDTGIGISVENQEHIFNRFIKAKEEDLQVYEGTGIGLSIARSYAEMLDGKIWLESERGKGTTFFVSLPLNSGKTNMKRETPDPGLPDGESGIYDMLIVDDDETSSEFLRVLLSPIAGRIHTASSGLEALEIFQVNPGIRFIFLDIRMPRMNGYEAAQRFREMDQDAILIAQTAYAMAGDREKALAAGFHDYLSKPINRDQLIRIISKYGRKTTG